MGGPRWRLSRVYQCGLQPLCKLHSGWGGGSSTRGGLMAALWAKGWVALCTEIEGGQSLTGSPPALVCGLFGGGGYTFCPHLSLHALCALLELKQRAIVVHFMVSVPHARVQFNASRGHCRGALHHMNGFHPKPSIHMTQARGLMDRALHTPAKVSRQIVTNVHNARSAVCGAECADCKSVQCGRVRNCAVQST